MGETIDTAPEQRRAVLVAVVRERQDERQANEYLDELEFLAETAGIRSVKRFTQRLAAPSAKTFVGEGKLAEMKKTQAYKDRVNFYKEAISATTPER